MKCFRTVIKSHILILTISMFWYLSGFQVSFASNLGNEVKTIGLQVAKPSWLKDKSLHAGLVLASIASGASTGLVESAKFSGQSVRSGDNSYHLLRTGQDISNIGYGYLIFAQISQENQSKWKKAGRVLESLCWRRDALELAYRWNVTGDAFNYSDHYTSNEKAIVYWKINLLHWKFPEFYVKGTGKNGAWIDGGFAATALLLHFLTN